MLEDEHRDAVGLQVLGAGDTHAPCQLIGPAVVGTAHLQDVLFAGGKTGHTDGAHAGLRARAEHTEHVDGGDAVGDLLAKFVLALMEQTGGGTAGVQKIDDRFTDDGVVGTEDGRAAGLEQVVVLVAVDVIEFGAFRLGKDQREGVVEREIVLDAAGDDRLGFVDHHFGLLALFAVVFGLVLSQDFRLDGIDGALDELVEFLVDPVGIRILGDCKSGIHSFIPPFG